MLWPVVVSTAFARFIEPLGSLVFPGLTSAGQSLRPECWSGPGPGPCLAPVLTLS